MRFKMGMNNIDPPTKGKVFFLARSNYRHKKTHMNPSLPPEGFSGISGSIAQSNQMAYKPRPACSVVFANRNYFESAMKLAWAAPFAIFLLLIQLI
jgi:hypothetical protein